MSPTKLRSLPALLLLPALLGANPAEFERRLGDALWQRFRVGSQETWGPRPTAQRHARLEKLVADFPTEPRAIQALARAALARGQGIGAWLAFQSWAAEHPDPEVAHATHAEFLIERAAYPEALAALERLADLYEGKPRAGVLSRMLQIIDQTHPEEPDPLRIHLERIAADPGEDSHKHAYLEAVRRLQGAERALEELGRLVPEEGRPDRWVDLQVELQEELGQVDQALAYLEARVRTRGGPGDHLRLARFLQRLERFEEVTAELEEGFTSDRLTPPELAQLFHWTVGFAHRREFYRPARSREILERLEQRWDQPLSRDHLRRLARNWDLLGDGRQQVRYLYRALLAARRDEDPAQEKAARRELLVAVQGLDDPGRVLAPGGQLVPWIHALDPHPGVLSGSLSFWWNGQDPAGNLAGLGTNLGADQAYARLDAWIAAAYRESPGEPHWDPVIRAWARRLERQEQPLEAADLLLRLAQDCSEPRRAAGLRLEALEKVRRAPAEARKGARERLETWAREILDTAREAGWEEEAGKAFALLEGSLRAREARAEVLALYRQEMEREGAGPDAYQRFLDQLTRYGVHDEAERVYARALRTFPGKDWYSRAARWYLKRKRRNALGELSRKAVEALSAPELASFLQQFLRYSRTGQGAARDSRLYLEAYRAAHHRFPHDLRFPQGLLRYHRYFGESLEAERLRFLYGYRIPAFWTAAMRQRMADGGLAGTLAALGELPEWNTAATYLRARSLEWLSEFEAAVPLWKRLASQCPDETGIQEETARALRSAGAPLEAETYYLDLARQFPRETRWPTLVGEVRLEGGDLEGAREAWRSLVVPHRGRGEIYLEAATVLWDYYLFRDAADLLARARDELDSPHLYARELAGVHLSRGAEAEAATEVVRYLVFESPWDSSMQWRLERLRGAGQGEAILATFDRFLEDYPQEVRVLDVMTRYLARADVPWSGQRQRLLSLAERTEYPRILSWVLQRARSQSDGDLERRCLERRVASRGARIADLEALCRFHLGAADPESAQPWIEKLRQRATSLPPARWEEARRIQRSLGDMLWSFQLRDPARQAYQAAIEVSRGQSRIQEQAHLARRLLEAKLHEEAATVLAALVREAPEQLSWRTLLADLRVAQGDLDALDAVHRSAVDSPPLPPGPAREAWLRRLRRAWVEDLHQLGAGHALPQVLWEMLLADPGDRGLVQEATRLAHVHGCLAALLDRARAWAEASPRDFRAHRMRAWMLAAGGRLGEARENLLLALREEPQKGALREELAGLLLRLDRPGEALEQYQQLRAAASRGSIAHLSTIAGLQAALGRHSEALETLAALRPEAVATPQQAEAQENYLRACWGIQPSDQLLGDLEALFEHLDAPAPRPLWSPDHGDWELLTRWLLERRGAVAALESLGQRLRRLVAWGGPGRPGYRERQRGTRAIRLVLRDVLLDHVRERETAAVREAFRGALERFPVALLELGSDYQVESFWRRAGFEPLYREAIEAFDDEDTLWNHLELVGDHEALLARLVATAETTTQDYWRTRRARRLARIRRLERDPAGELAALSLVPGNGAGSWWLNESERRRLLDLLEQQAGPEALAESLGTHGLWGVNEALRRERPRLALRLARRLEAGEDRWQLDAATRIEERFPERLSFPEAAYRQLLDLRDLGEQFDSQPDPRQSFVGKAYFPVALRYARALHRRGRPEQALAYASALLEGQPRSWKAGLATARMLAELGEQEEADRRLGDALARFPGNQALEREVVDLLLAWGRETEAFERLDSWVEDRGAASHAWERWIQAHRELERTERAVEPLVQVLAAAGEGVSLERLGRLLEQLDLLLPEEGREASYRRLLDAWKASRERCELLARRPGTSRRFQLEAFRLAVSGALGDPEGVPLRVRLGLVRRLVQLESLMGEEEATLAALARADELAEGRGSGDSGEDGVERATALLRIGRVAEAEKALEAYLRVGREEGSGPGLDARRWRRAHAALQAGGQEARAAQLRQRYYRLREARGGFQSRAVLGGLFRETLRAGQVAAALAAQDRLLAQDRRDASLRRWCASQLEEFGSFPEAALQRRRVLDLEPGGRADRLQLALDLLEDEATRVTGLGQLAALLREGRDDEATRDRAMRALQRLALSPEVMTRGWVQAFPPEERAGPLAREGLGFAALGRGEQPEARRHLEAAGLDQVLRTLPLKRVVELDEASGKAPRVGSEVLAEIRRREALRPGGPSRWTRLRSFLEVADTGAGRLRREALDLPRWLLQRIRGGTGAPDPLWRMALGGSLAPSPEGYQDYEGGDGSVDLDHDEVPTHAPPVSTHALGPLLDWGGDEGLGSDPFRIPEPPPPFPARLESWLGSLAPAVFLEALASSWELEGELDLARGALELAQHYPHPDEGRLEKRRADLEALATRLRLSEERRLVLAKED